jgi:hypothetical protein
MHDKLLAAGNFFSKCYGGPNKVVLDIGGTLREIFNNTDMTYISVNDKTIQPVYPVDPEEPVDPVDPVDPEPVDPEPVQNFIIKPGDKFPFENGSIDLIISSAFENDPCFWITFREMTRVIKPDGFIYLMSYSNFGENNKNYYYLGQSLSYWSSYQVSNEPVFPVKLIERFYILPKYDSFVDFICIWQRVNESQTEVSTHFKTDGLLEKKINSNGYITFIN